MSYDELTKEFIRLLQTLSEDEKKAVVDLMSALRKDAQEVANEKD